MSILWSKKECINIKLHSFFITSYFLEHFGIAVVCFVRDAQYRPAPSPIPVITDSATAADPDNASPNKGKNIRISSLTFNNK